ncbi:MAG: hypothetical protein QXJ75_02895 [Candidatus Bathyarchaeia archaeon]
MNKRCITEIVIGAIIIVTGLALELWSAQLYWIQTYPPPLGKQVLDILPPATWLIGGLLIADGLWCILTSKRAVKLKFTRSLLLSVVLTLCSLMYSEEVMWPDFYHINYGFPLAWLIRTLSTIAGPTDYFRINFPALSVDMISWFTVALVAFWFWSKLRKNYKA